MITAVAVRGRENNDSSPTRNPPNYVPNSVAAEYTIYPGKLGTSFGTGVVSAGAGCASAGNYTATGVNFSDPTTVTLKYDGSHVYETLSDSTAGISYTLAPVAENLSSIVGSSGYIGFTGGSVGDSSTVTFSNLSYSVPEPASLSLIGIGAAALLGRRRRVV